MGFMDKAKKMAEQAQAKLDEAQKQFNERQGSDTSGGAGGTPPVQYDSAGRPIPQEGPPATATPPHGDPLGGAAPAPPPPPAAPPVPPATEPAATAPPADPLGGAEPKSPPAPQAPATPPGPASGDEEDRNKPSHEPPKMSSGDPLAG
jgi:hypothetical protein